MQNPDPRERQELIRKDLEDYRRSLEKVMEEDRLRGEQELGNALRRVNEMARATMDAVRQEERNRDGELEAERRRLEDLVKRRMEAWEETLDMENWSRELADMLWQQMMPSNSKAGSV